VSPEVILERLNGTQTEITNKPPTGFTPEQIVYRRLGIDCKRSNFTYEIREKPTKKGDHSDFKAINKFALDIVGPGHYDIKGHDNEEDKPLDINVSRDSYVILQLPVGWMFLPKAVTLGGDKPDIAAYGELRYVVKNKVSEDYVANCRLVYFSAIHRSGSESKPYLQPLNFNVLMPEGLAVLVDPDIRFPGVGES
jgi:hypothetical protein